MTDSELRDAAARAAMAAMGASSLPADTFVLQEELLAGEVSAGHHGFVAGGNGTYSFSAIKDASGSFQLFEPLVATPAGMILAKYNLSDVGTYYCHVVAGKEQSYRAYVDAQSSVTNLGEGEVEVVTTKICRLERNDDGDLVVKDQYHVGTIVVRSGNEYIPGDDTNIVFTPVTSGTNKGKIKIDVYYK